MDQFPIIFPKGSQYVIAYREHSKETYTLQFNLSTGTQQRRGAMDNLWLDRILHLHAVAHKDCFEPVTTNSAAMITHEITPCKLQNQLMVSRGSVDHRLATLDIEWSSASCTGGLIEAGTCDVCRCARACCSIWSSDCWTTGQTCPLSYPFTLQPSPLIMSCVLSLVNTSARMENHQVMI